MIQSKMKGKYDSVLLNDYTRKCMRQVDCFDIGGTLVRFSSEKKLYEELSTLIGEPENKIKYFFRNEISKKRITSKQATDILCQEFNVLQEKKEILWNIINKKAEHNLFTDTIKVLKILKEKGYYLIAMSNAIVFRTYSLKELGLENLIEQVAYSYDFGFVKPQIEFFLRVEDSVLKEEKKKIVMVGDSLEKDVIPAKKCGWDAIWLNRSETGMDYDKKAKTLMEVLYFL